MIEFSGSHEICAIEAPTNQMMVDLISGWSSKLPSEAGAIAGPVPLFDDGRARWANTELKGVAAKTVLELGPLEGGHTYMLDRFGAKSILAIEANSRCFIRCLISKEIIGMPSAKFIYGDFMPWLEAKPRSFDVVWATGVLYHMVNPIRLLELIGAAAKQIHIWTHYVPDGKFDCKADWAQQVIRVENRRFPGRTIEHHVRSYFDQAKTAQYCGGVYKEASWLRRADIFSEIARLGFDEIVTGYEVPDHPNGPALALCASRSL